MHKFLALDSINQSCYEVIENFKNLEFNCKNYENFKKEILVINIQKNITAKQIIPNKTLKIVNSNKQLCTIFSNNIKLIALLEIKIRLYVKIKS